MISDVLADAIPQIRRYQQEMPQCYDTMRPELDALVAHMDRIREILDAPPEAGIKMLEEYRGVSQPKPKTVRKKGKQL